MADRKSFNGQFNDTVEGMTATLKDAAHPADATTVIGLFPTRPRLLALGEPTHGEDTLLAVRNDLFAELVDQQGYQTIAIESDCLKGLLVDDYLTSGVGNLDEVMAAGFSHGWGALAGNRELVRWIHARNADRSASAKLRFAGVDGPLEITAAASPRQALTALHDYLARWVDPHLLPGTREALQCCGSDEDWTEPEAMMDPGRSVGRTPEAGELRLIADELATLLDTQLPHLISVSSADELSRARLFARTATGLLRYHFSMADPSPSRMRRLCALRDQMMAENLLALAARGPVLVYAHNSHLQRDESSMNLWEGPVRWWGAGALVAAQLGAEYGFLATAVGTIPHHGVHTPPADTVEGLLYALPQDHCLVDTRSLVDVLGPRQLAPRVSPWFGYAPLDPARLAGNDGIVFVKDVQQQ